jgi:transcriptional regulator GlxA family with amidase domain
LFEIRYVALSAGPVECAHGLVMTATHGLADTALDGLLIPGFWGQSVQQVEAAVASNSQLIAALKHLDRRCNLWSYCTGVCLVAASGRLNGQAATATWWLADALLKRYPKVRWHSESNCLVNEKTATAAGVYGHLPIAQALIERQVSATVFTDLNRLMVLPRPASTHHAFHALSLIEQPSELLRRFHTVVQGLPAAHLTVQRLADELGLSERSLARKVSEETGDAVATYSRRIKLSQVSERLTLTSASITTISDELGFSSDSNMRRMFKALTALTPAQYRQHYAVK